MVLVPFWFRLGRSIHGWRSKELKGPELLCHERLTEILGRGWEPDADRALWEQAHPVPLSGPGGKRQPKRGQLCPLCSCCLRSSSFGECLESLGLIHDAVMIAVVQLLSHVWLFVTPWTSACQVSPSFTNSRTLLNIMSIESMMPSNHLILCHPFLLLPLVFPSIRVFSNELAVCEVAEVLALKRQSFQLVFIADFLYDWLVWSPCCPRDS